MRKRMRCCVDFCSNTSGKVSTLAGRRRSKHEGVSFHGFPREAHLHTTWLRALGKQDCHLPDSAVVCSEHFLHSDICETEGGSTQLKPGAVPSTVIVCLICLRTDSKMFLMSQYNLEEAYEKLTGYALCDGGNLKQTLCLQCAQRLRSFSRFREQSLRARSLMMELLEKHESITIQHIKMIDRVKYQLESDFVSTIIKPDHWDLCVEDNYDENTQKDSKETIQKIEVKIEGNESVLMDEDMKNIDNISGDPLILELEAYVEQEDKPQVSMKYEISWDDAHSAKEEYTSEQCKFSAPNEKGTQPVTNGSTKHTGIRTGGKTFACDICEYKNKRKSHLIRHMRSHNGERPFACELCEYKSKQKALLVKHMSIHTGEKRFACELCEYKSNQKCRVLMHMKIHTGEKPYACELCEYKCNQKSHLDRHMSVHTGEKPFACELCEYRAVQKLT